MKTVDKNECLALLGKTIKGKRQEKGYTQRQVCDMIGLSSQGHYSQIEAGQRDAEFVTLVKLCHVLDIDLNQLIASCM